MKHGIAFGLALALVPTLHAQTRSAGPVRSSQQRVGHPSQLLIGQTRPQVRTVQPGARFYPPQPNPFTFGMSLAVIRTQFGTGLRVASVTRGGPACRAGLEIGDIIDSTNGRRISYTRDSFAAVRQLNTFVTYTSLVQPLPGPYPGPAPADARQVRTRVTPGFGAPSRPIASMNVIDVRTGRTVPVLVYPTENYRTLPGPIVAPASPAAATSRPSVQGQRFQKSVPVQSKPAVRRSK